MHEYNYLQKVYEDLDADIKKREGEKKKLEDIITEKQREIEELEGKIYLYRQVNELFKEAAEYARKNSKIAIENIVSRALGIIFPGDLNFEIKLDEEGEKSEAKFLVSSTYGGEFVITNEPQETRGGGVVDIISLALRIALMEACHVPQPVPLVLDEPAKHVSGEYINNVADFLHQVVKSFNRQIIMVTHNQHLAAAGNMIYEVKIKNGESQLTAKN